MMRTFLLLLFSLWCVLLVSCGIYEIVSDTQATVETIKNTLDKVDTDGDQTITMQEIVVYLISGWAAGRGGEAVGARLLKKKNSGEQSTQ